MYVISVVFDIRMGMVIIRALTEMFSISVILKLIDGNGSPF